MERTDRSRQLEPAGRDWEAVEREHHGVIAVGTLAQCREAVWQWAEVHYQAGMVPASTYIRPRGRRYRPRSTSATAESTLF